MLIYWQSWIRSLRSQIHSFKCYSGNGKKSAPVETGAVTKKLTVYVSVLKNSFKIKNTFYKTEIFKIYCFTPKKPFPFSRLLRVIALRSLQSLRLFSFIRFAHSLFPARSFAPFSPFPLRCVRSGKTLLN